MEGQTPVCCTQLTPPPRALSLSLPLSPPDTLGLRSCSWVSSYCRSSDVQAACWLLRPNPRSDPSRLSPVVRPLRTSGQLRRRADPIAAQTTSEYLWLRPVFFYELPGVFIPCVRTSDDQAASSSTCRPRLTCPPSPQPRPDPLPGLRRQPFTDQAKHLLSHALTLMPLWPLRTPLRSASPASKPAVGRSERPTLAKPSSLARTSSIRVQIRLQSWTRRGGRGSDCSGLLLGEHHFLGRRTLLLPRSRKKHHGSPTCLPPTLHPLRHQRATALHNHRLRKHRSSGQVPFQPSRNSQRRPSLPVHRLASPTSDSKVPNEDRIRITKTEDRTSSSGSPTLESHQQPSDCLLHLEPHHHSETHRILSSGPCFLMHPPNSRTSLAQRSSVPVSSPIGPATPALVPNRLRTCPR